MKVLSHVATWRTGGIMIVVLILLCMIFLLVYLATRTYKKESFEDCDQKEHPLCSMYPTALFLYEKLQFHRLAKKEQRVKMAWRLLTVKGDEQLQFERYILKKISLVLVVLFCMTVLATCAELSSIQSKRTIAKGILKRPEGTKTQELTLDVTVEEEGTRKEEEFVVQIQPRKEEVKNTADATDQLQEEKLDAQQQEEYSVAYRFIDDVILNENRDLSLIGSDLYLPDTIEDSNLHVTWSIEAESPFDSEAIIDSDGTVHNENLEKDVQIRLCGTIYEESGQSLGTYQVSVTVIPLKQYQYETWKADLQATIERTDEETASESVLKLPTEFEGKQLRWKGKSENTTWYLLFFGVVIGVLVYIAMDEELQNKVKLRKRQMLRDYPDILNKLTLLIGAGMTVSGAWERIVTDYVKLSGQQSKTTGQQSKHKRKMKEEKRYAYEEMLVTNYELRLGVSEMKAIEDFGRRTGVVEYLKLSSALIQNMKKGAEGLTQILDLMAAEAFDSRKQRAKQLGEEAGTKLLIPMMIMLVLVLIIIMVPAFWSMQI